ncbi:hypothetical protein TNCV_2397101 [Trichonephila clavipes]|uniref:Uncharacterized protein n=1 Tax=Trichonephila clavipes TaxID=2585209 RepID=A0A8X6T4K0_TRICX|nr:hypothetical protein TNCV_2397101 [Trichonephila clavipes]
MNFLFHLFVVTSVALNAAIFTSASCDDDSDEESFFSFISYDVQILSDEQRTPLETFVNTVVETVYGRDTLRDVFDISDSTALQFQQYSYQSRARSNSKLGLVVKKHKRNPFDPVQMLKHSPLHNGNEVDDWMGLNEWNSWFKSQVRDSNRSQDIVNLNKFKSLRQLKTMEEISPYEHEIITTGRADREGSNEPGPNGP